MPLRWTPSLAISMGCIPNLVIARCCSAYRAQSPILLKSHGVLTPLECTSGRRKEGIVIIRAIGHDRTRDHERSSPFELNTHLEKMRGEMSRPAYIRMNRPTPEMRDLAGRLIAYEARLKKSRGMKTPVTFPALERLRPHLATFMGNAGFRALLQRALALAGAEVPWLRFAQVVPGGSLELSDEHKAQIPPNEMLEGRVAMLAHLLGLLVAFIGEKLTLQMVRDVWPTLPANDFNFSKRDRP